MKLEIKLKSVFCFIILYLSLVITGNVYAQHEGGLGEKKVHLNIASHDQLMKIEGMTDNLADAIIKYRDESGFFKKPEDLLKVPGINQSVYKILNPQTGSEGDIYCVPMAGTDDEFDEDEEPILSPSKC